jgi:hypothetical protein
LYNSSEVNVFSHFTALASRHDCSLLPITPYQQHSCAAVILVFHTDKGNIVLNVNERLRQEQAVEFVRSLIHPPTTKFLVIVTCGSFLAEHRQALMSFQLTEQGRGMSILCFSSQHLPAEEAIEASIKIVGDLVHLVPGGTHDNNSLPVLDLDSVNCLAPLFVHLNDHQLASSLQPVLLHRGDQISVVGSRLQICKTEVCPGCKSHLHSKGLEKKYRQMHVCKFKCRNGDRRGAPSQLCYDYEKLIAERIVLIDKVSKLQNNKSQ